MTMILTNAQVVTPRGVLSGTVLVVDGRIAEVQPGRTNAPAARDLEGDYLLPGAVDLHTDNLERHAWPRPNAPWPSRQALLIHDAQCAAAGVTTVFDALKCGDDGSRPYRNAVFRNAVADLRALGGEGLLRSDHFLHLRCELLAGEMLGMVRDVIDDAQVRLMSLTDHGPGVGQFASREAYHARWGREGLDPATIDRRMEEQLARRTMLREPNAQALLQLAAGRPIVLASHDDRSEGEVAANHAAGIAVSEFPVTEEAARAAKALGMQVVAGAPNIVRGGSHSGNVSAVALLGLGAVDVLASDYVPSSLIAAAFRCVNDGDCSLPEAVALVSEHPARLVGLSDRGSLQPGKRADMVRVRLHDGVAVVRETWKAGARIA